MPSSCISGPCDLDESGLVGTDITTLVEDWKISEDRICIRSNMTDIPYQSPRLFIGRIMKFEDRLDFIFSHHSAGYSLKGFNFHEVRGGSLYKLISGESIDQKVLSFEGPLKLDGDYTVHKITHHQYRYPPP